MKKRVLVLLLMGFGISCYGDEKPNKFHNRVPRGITDCYTPRSTRHRPGHLAITKIWSRRQLHWASKLYEETILASPDPLRIQVVYGEVTTPPRESSSQGGISDFNPSTVGRSRLA
jgi:hypothetical protein